MTQEQSKRETITFKTPLDEHEVEIYTYLTGREKREITNIFLSSASLSISTGKQDVKADNFDASLMDKANDKAITLLIASVDGKKENVLDAVLNMKNEDYDFVIAAINEIQQPKKK